jgi:hypothetical protein
MRFTELIRLGLAVPAKPRVKMSDLSVPVARMTPAEREFADAVIRQHFSEDRNEIISQSDTLTMLIAERTKARQVK